VSTRPWHPTLGAWCEGDSTRFRVWAPTKQRVDVVLETPGRVGAVCLLEKAADGSFSGSIGGVRAGDRYRYRLDGEGPYPDPASRFQPDGVHASSQVVDASRFEWSDAGWRGVRLDDLVVYELHVGAFSPAGNFAGVTDRLSYLRDLGVTAVELMPVADFPGERNWGYDGVALFAPTRCYGCPDDLRRLVDRAHQLGLGVLLDVVYNHLGPDGPYLSRFSPYYLSKRHQTPWGDALNLDGEHSAMVRAFLIENASHWVHEYHVDGLRLDATHALLDDSPRHLLAELSSRVRASVSGRTLLLIAEDHRNLARMVRPEADGGWGFDAVWADDLHHQIRRRLAGDHEGYYRDYTGSASDLAATLQRGWFFCGQHSVHLNNPRGTDPSGLAPRRFVICLQNHDQVGNRAFGERLHHQIDAAAYRAATVLLLSAPETPLLFMGQEWAASTPFLFFTDHKRELGKLVTEGRRREFKDFSAFADPQARQRIPDPQSPETFLRSRLNWSERADKPHASILHLYRTLLALRQAEPLLRETSWKGFNAVPVKDSTIVLVRTANEAEALVVIVQIQGEGAVDLQAAGIGRWNPSWEQILSTEDPQFSLEPMPPAIDLRGTAPHIHFRRPGALILRRRSNWA
jgi:maltooligosyltrehalose trehalohydrolase